MIWTENNALLPSRTVTGWRICKDYRKLNKTTRKDHFPLPFLDQMLDRLAGHEYYYFLDGYSGYNQITISPEDQEKTTFMCPYGAFSFKRMPFGLCNTPGTFQCCMMAIFSDMVKRTIEVFMDDFSMLEKSFNFLENLRQALIRCEETNLVLNWEKCHLMVNEGIVLGHRISERGIEEDKADRLKTWCGKYTPMCTSARVAPSNIVYQWYGYRSMGIDVLTTENCFQILS